MFDVLAVHGGWSDWEEGECIGACYGANKTNRRSCTNPAPLHEGRPCSGSSEEVLKCIPEDCGCEWFSGQLSNLLHVTVVLLSMQIHVSTASGPIGRLVL